MVLAENRKGRHRRLDHGDVVGLQNLIEDVEDALRKEGKLLGGLLDKGSKNLEGDLDIAMAWLVVRLCMVQETCRELGQGKDGDSCKSVRPRLTQFFGGRRHWLSSSRESSQPLRFCSFWIVHRTTNSSARWSSASRRQLPLLSADSTLRRGPGASVDISAESRSWWASFEG